MGCPPGLRAEKCEQYVLVVYMPHWNDFHFVRPTRPDGSDDLTIDGTERAALTWNSKVDAGVQIYCLGVVPLRFYEDVRVHDISEALQWSEERRRWRRQSLEPAPEDMFVQTFDPMDMSYGHCLGSDVPTNASWQPVGNVRDVAWPSDTASVREQKLQDENQALSDQIQLLETEIVRHKVVSDAALNWASDTDDCHFCGYEGRVHDESCPLYNFGARGQTIGLPLG